MPLRDPLPSPLAAMVRSEAFPGMLLVGAAVVAIVAANTWPGWQHVWEVHLELRLGEFALEKSVRHWINDGLMALFFFFVGLEIKREVLDGELRSLRAASLPILAAVGGMALPAALYWAVVSWHGAGDVMSGWGIPMATDIAFALGVLAVLGSRIPAGLKVFLATLAIVDDLGAVAVIAAFYTDTISWEFLVAGAFVLAASFACNRLGVRRTWPYVVFGLVLWVLFLRSGVHATIAGVALASTIPARRHLDEAVFSRRVRELLDEFDEVADPSPLTNSEQLHLVRELEDHATAVQAPLQRMEHGLSPVVAHLVMPVFALANAGVLLAGAGAALQHPAAHGVAAGLLVGKPLGVVGGAWLACKLLAAPLPRGASWHHLHGAAWLAGIGFTMALFIDNLAFPAETRTFTAAKTSILAASVAAAVIGVLVLLRASRSGGEDEVAPPQI